MPCPYPTVGLSTQQYALRRAHAARTQECECKSGGKNGKSSWVLPADAAGVAGRGRLEVSFASHCLYPFQPPTRLAYRNDSLPFTKQAAVAAAVSRQACNLTGSPMLHELVIWVYDHAARAIAEAKKKEDRSKEEEELRAKVAVGKTAMERTLAKREVRASCVSTPNSCT